jgi:hypothetical protein
LTLLLQNVGDGTQNTLGIIGVFVSRYISLSDAIAFGAVVAVETWYGIVSGAVRLRCHLLTGC